MPLHANRLASKLNSSGSKLVPVVVALETDSNKATTKRSPAAFTNGIAPRNASDIHAAIKKPITSRGLASDVRCPFEAMRNTALPTMRIVNTRMNNDA